MNPEQEKLIEEILKRDETAREAAELEAEAQKIRDQANKRGQK